MKGHTANYCIDDVPKSNAPINKLLQRPSERERVRNELTFKIFSNYAIPYFQKLVIAVLFSSGCRVSEALALRKANFTESGQFVVRGSKRSESAVYQLASFDCFKFRYELINDSLLASLNRWHLYRLLRSLGIYSYFDGNKCASVTHYFRHLIALEQAEASFNSKVTSRTLRHKSLKNVEFYTKKSAAKR